MIQARTLNGVCHLLNMEWTSAIVMIMMTIVNILFSYISDEETQLSGSSSTLPKTM